MAVKGFLVACKIPGISSMLTSQWGLKKALHTGVSDKNQLRDDALDGFRRPFQTKEARRALLKAIVEVDVESLEVISKWIPTLEVPVQGIYGAKDRILPDIAKTMDRLGNDLPQLEVTRLEDCGHFLQEEKPDKIGKVMGRFFNESD